ncbi:MAG TPA: hypothetical protein VFZ40_15690 [Pyrinomonadaceae bacterium]
MIVKFDYTPEEFVDAATRLLNRSKTYRRTWWYGLLATFVFGWLASFVLVFVIFRQMSIAVAIGSVIGLLCVATYPFSQEASVRRRLRSFVRERYGETSSFVCQVELTPTQIRTADANCQIFHEWSEVREIRDVPDAVEIITRGGGGIIVRNRAFETPEVRAQFIGLAKNYVDSGRT